MNWYIFYIYNLCNKMKVINSFIRTMFYGIIFTITGNYLFYKNYV